MNAPHGPWAHRHLLDVESLSAGDIDVLLAKASDYFEAGRKGPLKLDVLRGRTIQNVFFEASTRTRTSFELAGKRLGADVVNVSVSTSSVSKGETLIDTAKNLEAMHTDILVLRHSASGAPHMLAKRVGSAVVNAGDGRHEHPTQALLDAFTIRRAKGELAGLTVAICGDILNSRVARSNAILLTKKGARVRFAAPRTLLPRHAETIAPGVEVHTELAAALDGADVVMMLRIQNERLEGARLASTREYSKTFGLNARTFALAKKDAIVMHPGPINRGVELDGALADSASSVVLEQVEAGVAVRMATLALVASVPKDVRP
ncbi:MAG: aspartate carbamoyltransferase catalytic subunit [Polyangiaceae bacterium]